MFSAFIKGRAQCYASLQLDFHEHLYILYISIIMDILYSPGPTAEVNVKSPYLINRNVCRCQRLITVLLDVFKIFIRHHCKQVPE